MDARTHNRNASDAHPALRTLALALALATLPAIGAGIEPAVDEFIEPQATSPAATTVTTVAPGTVEAVDGAVATDVAPEPVEAVEPVPVIKIEAPSPLATLEPGEFLWHPEVSPSGPVVIVVSLPEQRAHVYRNGLRIGVSTISSGKPGHETPTGEFPILQKRVEHYSNLYDNAPMPYMQRLTWGGVALHAGRIPGYPASHGCIRLPREFAELLYDVTRHGTTVVVADESSHSAAVVSPGPQSPVDSYTGLEPSRVDVASLARTEHIY